MRLTIRDVPEDEQVYQALLVEDRTRERLGTKDEKSKLAAAVLDEKHLPLTNREKQVAAGLLQGSTRLQLAEDLYISEDTVKSHISNIYRKLKVHSRIELAHRVLGHLRFCHKAGIPFQVRVMYYATRHRWDRRG